MADLPSSWGVLYVVIVSVDCGMLGASLSLARTSFRESGLVFVRLRQGLGMLVSSACGCRMVLSVETSRSGVYGSIRKVSYWHIFLSFARLIRVSC